MGFSVGKSTSRQMPSKSVHKTALSPRWLSRWCIPVLLVCRGHHRDKLVSWLLLVSWGSEHLPGHCITPPSLHLIVFSSYAPTLLSQSLSVICRLLPPFPKWCVAEEVCQCREQASTIVLGSFQSWGGVHYAWPPTQLQSSMAYMHRLQLKHVWSYMRLITSGPTVRDNTTHETQACISPFCIHTQV